MVFSQRQRWITQGGLRQCVPQGRTRNGGTFVRRRQCQHATREMLGRHAMQIAIRQSHGNSPDHTEDVCSYYEPSSSGFRLSRFEGHWDGSRCLWGAARIHRQSLLFKQSMKFCLFACWSLCFYFSFNFFVSVSICLSVYLSVCLSVCLSAYVFV